MRAPAETHHADVIRQPEELPRALILRTLLATIMIGIALCFATYVLMRGRLRVLRPSHQFPERALPAPRERAGVREEPFRIAHPQPSPNEQRRAWLDSFGWVDRSRRIVHIPIEDAIELMARAPSRRAVSR